jgi:hypothetical protein
MKVEYELTEDDLVDSALFDQRNAPHLFPQARKRGWTHTVLVWVIVLPMLIGLFIVLPLLLIFTIARVRSTNTANGIVVGLMLVIWLMTYVLRRLSRRFGWNRKLVARSVRRANRRGLYDCFGLITTEITPGELLVFRSRGNEQIPWSSFECAVRDENAFFLYTTPARAIIIPRRAFADEAQAQEFYETALRCIEAGKKQFPTLSR